MRSVPGGLRRLLRDRGRLIAVVLLATVALSASGIQSAAAVALHRTLDSNWRGAYDVLVTAKGTVPGAAGMIAPNALSSADQRMTLADVAKIRSVAGIDVAAPIGEVVVSGLALGNPTIALPQGVVDASTVPQAFQVTTTYSTNDGLGPRYVTSKTSNVVIDETPRPPIPPPSSCNLNGFDVDVVKYPLLCIGFGFGQQNYIVTVQEGSGWGAGETVTDGVIHFQTYDAPQGSTRITLVDPVAERKLLGDGANFLRPLISLSPSLKTSTARMTEWAQASDIAYAKDFHDYQAALDSNFASYTDTESTKQFRAFEQEYGVEPDQASGPPPVYVPLLTANAGAAALTVSTTVRALGPAPRAASPQASFPYELPPAGASSTPSLGTTTVDGSALLNPFALAAVDVDWPGTHSAPIALNPIFKSLQFSYPGTVAGVHYTMGRAPDGSTRASLTASGYGQPIPPQGTEVINPFTLVEDGFTPGLESVYSPVTLLPQPHNGGSGVGVPVGSFSTGQLEGLQSSLSYVPPGPYQPIGSTVKSGGKTATLKPSVTGLGIESPRTIAIASINSAPAWHQTAPVTAVRVRVAGISSYSLQAQQKVVSVAQAIQKLGFTATIVAGSSPTAVTVTVKNYAFGVADAGGKQRVGALGNIAQDWSELGAAARADVAISASSLSVLGIALGSTALLLGAVQFASVPGRRGQAIVLRELGWTRRRIRRWMAAEEIPGMAVVLLAGVAAALLSGFAQVSVLIATLGFIAVVVTSSVAIALG